MGPTDAPGGMAFSSLSTTSRPPGRSSPSSVAELVGEIAQYQDVYRLCFLRGPEGIVVGLAEQLG